MKGKIIIIVVIAIVILLCKSYYDNHSNNGILENVTNRDGYILDKKDEEVTVTLFIKPEWIFNKSDKEKKFNKEIVELNGTKIILDNVKDMDNEMYFSFTTRYDMDYYHGKFMYCGIFNEDGTYSTFSDLKDFTIYDINHNEIDIGSIGFGSESDFSFGISSENYDKINEGFYVDVNCLILYEYLKK